MRSRLREDPALMRLVCGLLVSVAGHVAGRGLDGLLTENYHWQMILGMLGYPCGLVLCAWAQARAGVAPFMFRYGLLNDDDPSTGERLP